MDADSDEEYEMSANGAFSPRPSVTDADLKEGMR